jgi:two-component system response regulator PhoP
VSDTERRFLKVMVEASGQVVGRDALIAACGQDIDDYDPHRLDAVISRLRKRTEQAGLGSLPLQSIRGTGYVFSA